MIRLRTVVLIIAAGLFIAGTASAQDLDENWNDFLHYTKIGRLDLAKGYAQAVLNAKPDPVKLLALSEANQQGYAILLKVKDTTSDMELTELTTQILNIIEQGRFARRADPQVIVTEIRRLNTTERGRIAAVKRLQNSGEYAIPFMLKSMAQSSDQKEMTNLIWALSKIGRGSIRPLAASLQIADVGIKAEVIRSLGKIGYPQSLAYLKYVIEKDTSPELRRLAEQSINLIDPAALQIPAAKLFYMLAKNYYYNAQSLAPVEDADFANIWFWDAETQQLVRQEVARSYFNELMTMQACEWSLRADPGYGDVIGLWQAAYFKAESFGIAMPEYFGPQHADAMVYATTAGPEYLHQALARAVEDADSYIALGAVEALATTAGEKSLLYRVGMNQPLAMALSFDNKPVRYSAAIAIAGAGPQEDFPDSRLVITNLIQALAEPDDNKDLTNPWVTESYAVRAAEVMVKLGKTKNPVIDLSGALSALVKATSDSRTEIQALSAEALAYLNSSKAQTAIAVMALSDSYDMDIRISAFNSLAVSAKFNANLLDNTTVDAVYLLVSSTEVDPALRSAAAVAYGSLNLPSRKIKDLILDQSRR